VKRESTVWEKIFANDISDKVLISKYIRNSYCLIGKINNLIKMRKHLNSHFSKDDTQMANRSVKRCLTSQILWKIQIKTTMK
jgi:hypothetical protein